MPYDPKIHNHHSIRLEGYDYSQSGAYFVTICLEGKKNLLGHIVSEKIALNCIGKCVQKEWENLPLRFPTVELDQFVIMPNHFHGILLVGAVLAPPSSSSPAKEGAASSTPTLGKIIRAFKSLSAIQANKLLNTPGQPFWQRNYFEHIIRTEKELNQTRDYIADNPIKWETDEENPNTKPS